MPMTITSRNGYMYSYKNKPEKIKNEKYNTDIVEPYIQEFIKDKLYLTWTNKPITVSARSSIHYFTIDDKLRYTSFFADFGPLNIAQVIKFCDILNSKFKSEELKNKKIVLVSGPDNDRRANSAFLMCAYLLLVFNLTPDEAYRPIAEIAYTFEPYRDAGYGPATYFITIKHCLQGLYKAIKTGLLDIDSLDVEEYEYYEKVENGDLNWITKKFIAFASPKERPTTHGMYSYDNQGNMISLIQSDINNASSQWFKNGKDGKNGSNKILYPANSVDGIVKYFKENGVTCVVRLNNKLYDNRKFIEAGINHYEFYFPDGTIPPDNILFKFFELCETNPGSIAIHCKAGLGRTGTLIGAYLMKTYKFLASEVIAFLRLMRPGCVVGPQQNYLQSIEQKLLRMKVTPLPYQISCVKAPTSNIIKRFNVDLPFTYTDDTDVPMRSKSVESSCSSDIFSQAYENNKKKTMYTSSSSPSPSSLSYYNQRNNKQPNSTEFNKNGFSIPVQPRKTMEYQNNNNNNNNNIKNPNENSENILLRQIDSNDLRLNNYNNMNIKSKSKFKSKSPHMYGGDNNGMTFLEDNIRNLTIMNGRRSGNERSSSLQQFSRSNNKNLGKNVRDLPYQLKKTKSDSQPFQRFYNGGQTIPNSSSSKLKKPMYSPHNHSTPVLPQTRLYSNNGINRNNPFSSGLRHNTGFSNSTNNISPLTFRSISNVTATPNLIKRNSFGNNNDGGSGHNYFSHSHSNGYLGGSSRSYYNDDADAMENKRNNYEGNKSFHEKIYNNIMRKNDNYYIDYMRSQKYGKKDN